MQFFFRLAAVAATLPLLSHPLSAVAESIRPQTPQIISQFDAAASCQQSVRDKLRSEYGNGVYLTFQGSATRLPGPAGRQIIRGNAAVEGDRGQAEILYICSTYPRNATVESTNYRITGGSLSNRPTPGPTPTPPPAQFNSVQACQQNLRDRLNSDYNSNITVSFRGSTTIDPSSAGREIVRSTATARNNRSTAELSYTCETYPRNARVESLTYRITSGSLSGSTSEPTDTLTRFDTRTYSVRVYRDTSGRTLMNVYDKRAARSLIQGGLTRTSSGQGNTGYTSCSTGRTNCDGTEFTVTIERSGRQSLTIRQGSTVTTEVTTSP